VVEEQRSRPLQRVENWRRLGVSVDKIFKGAKPGDLPGEQVMKFDLTINLKTPKALGPKIPQSLLMRADEMIECRAEDQWAQDCRGLA